MWQILAYQALDITRERQLDEAHRRRLRHPGGIEEELLFNAYGYPSNGAGPERGPNRLRRASARLAAAVSVRAAGLARSLDESSFDGDRLAEPHA